MPLLSVNCSEMFLDKLINQVIGSFAKNAVYDKKSHYSMN